MSDSLPAEPVAGDLDVDAQADALVLRYRSEYGAPPPRRIRLQIPGWGGVSTAHETGAPAQPWHCQPFVEGATHGFELIYPYRNECRVSVEDGRIRFAGPIEEEMGEAGLPHPFGAFAAGHYGMATALDLFPPPGYALRLGPHPRFFTETSGDVPLALPGHLQRFWPRQFFAVFRAPPPGATHVFRPGEPYAQLLLVRPGESWRVQRMEPELAADRAAQDRQVTTLGYLLAKKIWRSDAGLWFDDKYKRLQRIFTRGGLDAVRRHLHSVADRATPKPRD